MATASLPVFSDPTYRIEIELGSGGGGAGGEVEALKNVKSVYRRELYSML